MEHYLLLVLVLATALPGSLSTDVEWYISPTGSEDIATCGHTPDNPCRSLQVILNESPSFDNGSIVCYLSSGIMDDRNSTTLYFMGELNEVLAVCLMNWTNLRVVGLGENTTITSGRFGGERGIFEFIFCTNVSVEGLNFGTSPLNRAVLFFEASRDISIANCSFPVTSVNSLGLQILHSAGDIVLTGNIFYSNPSSKNERLNLLGLDITHGCKGCTVPFSNELYDFSNSSFTLTMVRCVFEDIGSLGEAENNYQVARSSAVALRLRLADSSSSNHISILDSNFTRITHLKASAVLVTLSNSASNNSILFQGCTFTENAVHYGGGIAAYFYADPSRNSLEIDSCDFQSNVARLEGGGVFAAFLSSNTDNTVTISRSRFQGNYALYGSAIFLLNNPSWLQPRGAFHPISLPLVEAEIRGCEFSRNGFPPLKLLTPNFVLKLNGVITGVRLRLNISGTTDFVQYFGSGIRIHSSLLNLQGNFNFSNGIAITGAAINVRDGSKVMMDETVRGFFQNNLVERGGAIFADSASTTHLAVEFTHIRAQNLFGFCFLTFGNEPTATTHNNVTDNTERFTFRNNTALVEGNDVSAFNLRGCLTSNFVPEMVSSNFLNIPSDGTVRYEVSEDRNPLETSTTGPSFLFFYGASSRCYKTVNNITYFLPNCSNSLLTSTFFRHPDIRCGLQTWTNELSTLFALPGSGLRPTVDKLTTPWATLDTDWMVSPGTKRSACPESNPANIVLSPSPGEEFDLTIQLTDQQLNFVTDNAYLSIEDFNVLIQSNGLQYGARDRVYFTPNRPLSNIAFVGPIGAKGNLLVVAESQLDGLEVTLRIPFKLAPCPPGFYPTPALSNISLAFRLMVTRFNITQRIPADQPLACQCFTDQQEKPLVKFSSVAETSSSIRCIARYTLQLSSIFWAGYIPEAGQTIEDIALFPETISCPETVGAEPISDMLTEAVLEYRESGRNSSSATIFNDDVVPFSDVISPGGGAPVMCFNKSIEEVAMYQPNGVFTIEQCSQGFCRGDATSSWAVANVSYPCDTNRKGPLCGQCVSGTAVTLYSTVCRDCTEKPAHYYGSLFLTLFFGLLLVIVVVVFNIGASPTVDSFLFFVQTVYLLLLGRNDFEVFKFLAFFKPNFTFDLCITPSLDVLTKLILEYVTPVYILLLILVILILTRIRRFSRLFGRHSILQALWFLFLICYLNIASTTFGILYCGRVGPVELNGTAYSRQLVLISDASVKCYQGLHLFYAIIALIVATLFVVPLPLYTLVMSRVPKLKPISDVYCSCYKDNRRWWILISLARRLLLVVVGVFVQDYVSRHYGLLICIAVILLVLVVTAPYSSSIDNCFAYYVTWMLLMVAVVTQPDVYLREDPKQAITLFLVSFTVFSSLILLFIEIALRLLRKKTLDQYMDEIIMPQVGKYRRKLSKMNWRGASHHNRGSNKTEDSTISTVLPKHNVLNVSSYRETLLDSQFYQPEEIDKLGIVNTLSINSNDGDANSGGADESPSLVKKKFSEDTPTKETAGVSQTEISLGCSGSVSSRTAS